MGKIIVSMGGNCPWKWLAEVCRYLLVVYCSYIDLAIGRVPVSELESVTSSDLIMFAIAH